MSKYEEDEEDDFKSEISGESKFSEGKTDDAKPSHGGNKSGIDRNTIIDLVQNYFYTDEELTVK